MNRLNRKASLRGLARLQDQEPADADELRLRHGRCDLPWQPVDPRRARFVQRLQTRGHKFLFLTNNSQWTPRDLKHKLEQMGISVDEAAFHTSALATADFLGRQKPAGPPTSSAGRG